MGRDSASVETRSEQAGHAGRAAEVARRAGGRVSADGLTRRGDLDAEFEAPGGWRDRGRPSQPPLRAPRAGVEPELVGCPSTSRKRSSTDAGARVEAELARCDRRARWVRRNAWRPSPTHRGLRRGAEVEDVVVDGRRRHSAEAGRLTQGHERDAEVLSETPLVVGARWLMLPSESAHAGLRDLMVPGTHCSREIPHSSAGP
jgi:hypothetical protein